MKQAAALLLCLVVSQVWAQYGPPPTKGKKHRTTTTTTEGPGSLTNEITGPFPDSGSYAFSSSASSSNVPGSNVVTGGSYWWQGPNSPFKPGSQPHSGIPSGCGAPGGGCGPVNPPPPPPPPSTGGCGGPAGCTGVATDPRPSPFEPPSKPIDISQNPFLSSAILGKPIPQSPQGCQGPDGSCQYPVGQGTATGPYPGQGGSPTQYPGQPGPTHGGSSLPATGPTQFPGTPTTSGQYPGQPTGTGPYPSQPTGTGPYPSQPTGTGSYPGKPTGTGPYPGQPTGTGPYPGQPTGTGPYPGQPTGTGSYPGQPTGTGSYPGQPTGTGPYTGQPTGTGPFTGQPVPLRPQCAVPGHACVPSSMCVGGVITPNGMRSMRDPQVKECIPGLEACCRLPPGSPGSSPFYNPVTPTPVYVSQRPYTGPLNTTPFPGCAAALKCVAEIYCTAEGVMANTPVILTREQAENKVPLTDCQDPDTGIIGKCCRDPNYKDPWPAGMMMKNPGDFDDGQYHGEGTGPTGSIVPNYNTISSTPQSPAKDHGPKPSDSPGGFNKPFPPPYPGNTPSNPSYPNYQPGQPTPTGSSYQPGPSGSPFQPGQPQPGSLHKPGQQHPPGSSFQPDQPTPFGTPYQPGQPTPTGSYQPGQPSPTGSSFQPDQPTPFGTPYQPGQPTPTGSYQPGQPSGTPYQPGQTGPTGTPFEPDQPSGSPYQPGQQSPAGTSFQPDQPSGSTYQPGQPSPTGTSFQPGQPSGSPYQPGKPSGSSYQPGQPSPTGTSFQPDQPSGSPFQPGQPNPTGTSFQPDQPSGSPFQPGQPGSPSQTGFPEQNTDYNLPTHPGQNQPSQPGFQEQGPAPGSSCGIRRPGPGGDVAGFAEFPWQALVVSAGNRSLLCGAAVISETAVITAAHCVNQILAKDLLVKAGEWKLLGQNPKPVQVRPVVAIARHPGYNSGSLAKDLAILIVGQPFNLDYHVDKICIPSELGSEYFQKPGQNCLITGWGKGALQEQIPNSDLHKVNVSVVPAKQCEAKLKTSQNLGKFFILSEGFSCALPPSPADLCKVDFGSAVACKRGDGHYELAGVNSWDIACPTKQPLPSVFATSDAQWINTVLSTPLPVLQAQEESFNQNLFQGESVDGVDIDDKPGFSQGYGK